MMLSLLNGKTYARNHFEHKVSDGHKVVKYNVGLDRLISKFCYHSFDREVNPYLWTQIYEIVTDAFNFKLINKLVNAFAKSTRTWGRTHI